MSLPPPPSSVSPPVPPIRTLAALLPVRTLSRSLPVALMRGSAEQRHVLNRANGMDRIGKVEADLGENPCLCRRPRLVHHVAGVVDHIGVVASATIHRVGTGIPMQHVGASTSD